MAKVTLRPSNEEILHDLKTTIISRQTSFLGRAEVLQGRAKFGIFGDGKELAQVAMARFFQKGDWRSGYYRDQTFMFAAGLSNVREFFAQLYADPNVSNEPASAGRQMNCHFSTQYIDKDGNWLNQLERKNSSADVSPTGGQMARLVGLGYASKLYRQVETLRQSKKSRSFSENGNEVAFGTIGNASTSEGVFFEAFNASGVLKIPVVFCVWDDDYGISVPSQYQTTKSSIFKALQGFKFENGEGIHFFQARGHSYLELLDSFAKASALAREKHAPCLVYVYEMTQPQGHSTSGSHERYKSKERLCYEDEKDCIKNFKNWIVEQNISDAAHLQAMEEECIEYVKQEQVKAWNEFLHPIRRQKDHLLEILQEIKSDEVEENIQSLQKIQNPLRRDIQSIAYHACLNIKDKQVTEHAELLNFYQILAQENQRSYSSHLLSEKNSPLDILTIPPKVTKNSKKVDGRQIIQKYFDIVLTRDPRVFIIGEDIGKLGGVNLEFEGLNETHGELRVTDTGIREATILGQGIGAAMRGLRPVADIQYLDYLVYALQGLTDDVATLAYRSFGQQKVPLIIRTKGHRLEGIWHTGSPMQMLLGSLRGIHLCVPRNCTQAAGMYQTLLQGDDPGLVIEVLNGYRIKEICPENLGEYSVPLGQVEVLQEGRDLTLVTFGANIRLVQSALSTLHKLDIFPEIVDIQTLLPFDLDRGILKSVQKTNAILFLDEDVSSGATSFMMQKVLEEQGALDYLDANPRSLSAKDHRSAYGSDGDYFSKPNQEQIISACYEIMRERFPHRFVPLNFING